MTEIKCENCEEEFSYRVVHLTEIELKVRLEREYAKGKYEGYGHAELLTNEDIKNLLKNND